MRTGTGDGIDVCTSRTEHLKANVAQIMLADGPLHLGHLVGPLRSLVAAEEALLLLDDRGITAEQAREVVLDLLAAGLHPDHNTLVLLSRLGQVALPEVARRLGGRRVVHLAPSLLSPLLLSDTPARLSAKIRTLDAPTALAHLATVEENPEVCGELKIGMKRGEIPLSLVHDMLTDRVETALLPLRRRRALYARMPELVQSWMTGGAFQARQYLSHVKSV